MYDSYGPCIRSVFLQSVAGPSTQIHNHLTVESHFSSFCCPKDVVELLWTLKKESEKQTMSVPDKSVPK